MVTIEVDEEVWRDLQVQKNPGDSFNDVLRRVLDLDEPTRDAPADDVAAAIDAYVPDDKLEIDTDLAREATRQAVAFLRDHEGGATRSTIVAAQKPGDVSEQQWWARGAQPGLAMLAERGLVDRPTTKTYAMEG